MNEGEVTFAHIERWSMRTIIGKKMTWPAAKLIATLFKKSGKTNSDHF